MIRSLLSNRVYIIMTPTIKRCTLLNGIKTREMCRHSHLLTSLIFLKLSTSLIDIKYMDFQWNNIEMKIL